MPLPVTQEAIDAAMAVTAAALDPDEDLVEAASIIAEGTPPEEVVGVLLAFIRFLLTALAAALYGRSPIVPPEDMFQRVGPLFLRGPDGRGLA